MGRFFNNTSTNVVLLRVLCSSARCEERVLCSSARSSAISSSFFFFFFFLLFSSFFFLLLLLLLILLLLLLSSSVFFLISSFLLLEALGDIWETSGGHLGDIWEASGASEAPWSQRGILEGKCVKIIVFYQQKCGDPLFRLHFGGSTFTLTGNLQQLSANGGPGLALQRNPGSLELPPEPLINYSVNTVWGIIYSLGASTECQCTG